MADVVDVLRKDGKMMSISPPEMLRSFMAGNSMETIARGYVVDVLVVERIMRERIKTWWE